MLAGLVSGIGFAWGAMGTYGAKVSILESFAEAVGASATYGYGMRSEAENKVSVIANANGD